MLRSSPCCIAVPPGRGTGSVHLCKLSRASTAISLAASSHGKGEARDSEKRDGTGSSASESLCGYLKVQQRFLSCVSWFSDVSLLLLMQRSLQKSILAFTEDRPITRDFKASKQIISAFYPPTSLSLLLLLRGT